MSLPVTHWCPTMHLLSQSLNMPKHVMWTVSNIHCGGEMDYLGRENELSYGAELRACVSKYTIRMLWVNDLISGAIRSASVLSLARSGTEGVSGWRWMDPRQTALIQCTVLFIFLLIFNDFLLVFAPTLNCILYRSSISKLVSDRLDLIARRLVICFLNCFLLWSEIEILYGWKTCWMALFVLLRLWLNHLCPSVLIVDS